MAAPNPLTTYSTYDGYRAILGITSQECPDTYLATEGLATVLLLDLEDISTLLPASYDTVAAIAVGTRTTAQQRVYDLVRLFSTYAVSKNLLTSLPLLTARSFTDGKAAQERYDAFDEIEGGVNSGFALIKAKLQKAYSVLEPTFATPTAVTSIVVVSTGLATDPVTGV